MFPKIARAMMTPSVMSRVIVRHCQASGPTSDLTITESCVRRLKEIIENSEEFLRVDVESGGCSGFSYIFKVDTKLNPETDVVFSKDGHKIVVDKDTLPYINGASIDYHTSLIKSSFRIVNNPVAGQNCSCGSSFSVDLDKISGTK